MFLFVGSEHGGFLNGASFWQHFQVQFTRRPNPFTCVFLCFFKAFGKFWLPACAETGSGLGYFKDRVEIGVVISMRSLQGEDFAVYAYAALFSVVRIT